jgi:hypothetical protein
MLGINCSDCEDDPELKALYGCEEPTQVAVWEDEVENEFYNCPLRWLTEAVLDWYELYAYDMEFHKGLSYDRQSNRYIEAWKVYRLFSSKFSLMQSKRHNQSKDLQVMAQEFIRNKDKRDG